MSRCIFFFLVLLTLSNIQAQNTAHPYSFTAGLDISKPTFQTSGSDEGISHSSVFGYLRSRIAFKSLSISLALPFSHYEFKDPGGRFGGLAAHSTFGNLGIDFTYTNHISAFWYKTSIRFKLPTMPNPDYPREWGFLAGFVADIENRDSYAQENFSYGAHVRGGVYVNQNLEFDIALGINNWTHVGDFDEIQDQLYILHSVNITVRSEYLNSFSRVKGSYKISDDSYPLNLKDDVTQIETGFIKEMSRFQILLSISTPLNYDFVRHSIKFGISYEL